jgi:hypothetical protein
LAALLVSRSVELEPAFDKDRAAFAQVLLRDFGLLAPERHVDKGRFLVFLAFLGPMAGDRQGYVNESFPPWRVSLPSNLMGVFIRRAERLFVVCEESF